MFNCRLDPAVQAFDDQALDLDDFRQLNVLNKTVKKLRRIF